MEVQMDKMALLLSSGREFLFKKTLSHLSFRIIVDTKMGNCQPKKFGATLANTSLLLPAKLGNDITVQEICDLFTKNGIDLSLWKQLDNKYKCIDFFDFDLFKTVACVYPEEYKAEIFDCDNFALVFLGRCLEYYSRNNAGSAPIFGFMTGDIRLNDGDPMRIHAVNWFISDKDLYIYEPMYNEIHLFNKNNMTVHYLLA